jgi:signal transduction histidine kinase
MQAHGAARVSQHARVLIEELGLEVTVRRLAEGRGPEAPPDARVAQDARRELVARFAGGIAHELNNLLTAIAAYNELILDRMSDTNPLRRDAIEIEKAVERAHELTRQLLAVAQRQVDVPSVFELDAFVTRLEPRLRRIAGEDVALELALAAGTAAVRASAEQLEEAVAQLVQSACAAMGGAGALRVETAAVELEAGDPSGASPGRYAQLVVVDTGPLLDGETRERIFEPFLGTRAAGRARGLELAAAYGLVAQNGGYLAVTSETGRGTAFAVVLPLADEVASPLPEPAAAEPGGDETVLVVEDEDVVRLIVRETLERHGYAVLEARGGTEAIAVAEGHEGTIDLLLTDVVMPGMTGLELAGRLRTVRPGLRVLYMSGSTEADVAGELELRPGTGFVEKPMTPSALARRVRAALDEVLDAPG